MMSSAKWRPFLFWSEFVKTPPKHLLKTSSFRITPSLHSKVLGDARCQNMCFEKTMVGRGGGVVGDLLVRWEPDKGH